MTASNHKPKLRRVEPRRIQYQGQPFIQLHDPLGIADRNILLPEGVAPLLALADGTRDAAGLQASLLLHTGVHVSQEQIQELIDGLDEACLLDNDTYEAAVAAAMASYREADSRPPSHAGAVYPDNRSRLAAALSDYEGRAPDVEPLPASTSGHGRREPAHRLRARLADVRAAMGPPVRAPSTTWSSSSSWAPTTREAPGPSP